MTNAQSVCDRSRALASVLQVMVVSLDNESLVPYSYNIRLARRLIILAFVVQHELL